jgi:surface antigen
MRISVGPSAQLFGSAVLCAVALWVLSPGEISAQLGRKNFEAMPKLTQGDLTMIRKLVREQLTTKPKGTTLSWNNPDSTNSGTVTLINNFASQGRKCYRVQYAIVPGVKKAADVKPQNYTLNNCQMADGSWKIDSQAQPDKAQP